MTGPEEYRVTLLRNFKQIGTLARENDTILKTALFPLLEKEELLTKEEADTLHTFREELINSVSMENLDLPILYAISVRLHRHAVDMHDEDAAILALDELISSASAYSYMTQRLNPVSGISLEYRNKGLSAALRLMEDLTPERFTKLSNTSKELALINARYIASLFDRTDAPGSEKVNASDLAVLQRALSFSEDPFYVEQVPDYNWVYHNFRTLQYISHLAGSCNGRRFNHEQMRVIYECSLRLKAHWEEHFEELSSYSTQQLIDLTVARASYCYGAITLDAYRKQLVDIFNQRDPLSFTFHSNTLHLVLPTEYLHTLHAEHLTHEEEANLAYFYRELIQYVHRMPKKGSLSFLLTYLSDILKEFIRVPDGPDFETLCIQLIAALHPPTYVHTLSCADITKCLAGHLYDRSPELFQDIPFVSSKEELEEFAYHAGLCHDFGKLFVMEEIITYGRQLLNEEFELIQCHPRIGTYILSKYKETKDYAGVALMHHKWFDESAGYPADYLLEDYPEKAVIAVVACADCLDACTDAVGRSYKEGKTLDDFLIELKEGSGTRYAPYLYALFEDPAVREDVTRILTDGRNEKYRMAYEVLTA